jgi:hypothetical protein
MKLVRLLPACLALASVVLAQETFPGLQRVLNESEWKRAGLDKLTPDQIGVIDAALIRFHAAETRSIVAAATATTPPEPPAGATPAEAAALRSRFWDKFGITKLTSEDWRRQPPMSARVTAWQGANRFALDTGQVWEGTENITYEILGQEVVIAARPMGRFALTLKDGSAEIRVRRVK